MVSMKELEKRAFSEQALELAFEFNRYVIDHPEIAKKLGEEACLVFQVEGEEQFSRWSRRVAAKHIKDGKGVVYVKIKKMKPVRSRIEKLELVKTQSFSPDAGERPARLRLRRAQTSASSVESSRRSRRSHAPHLVLSR
jgi:hypothetical protein